MNACYEGARDWLISGAGVCASGLFCPWSELGTRRLGVCRRCIGEIVNAEESAQKPFPSAGEVLSNACCEEARDWLISGAGICASGLFCPWSDLGTRRLGVCTR